MNVDFAKILETGNFPEDIEFFYNKLLLPNDNGDTVSVQESEILDFKDVFPYSKSDDYCAGIIRLIISFHNTYGGFVVFGVEDETGKTGKNHIRVTLEALNKKIKEVTDARILLKHLHIDKLNVDIVLVQKRPITKAPVYLKKISISIN